MNIKNMHEFAKRLKDNKVTKNQILKLTAEDYLLLNSIDEKLGKKAFEILAKNLERKGYIIFIPAKPGP